MGDTVALNGVEFHVVGIMTLADNQALFQSNSDFTVNTLSFGAAEVSSEGFKALENTGFLPSYTYSYRFADRNLSVADRVDIEKDMVSALSDAHANVTDLTDVDSNQGIGYAKDDVSGDSAMWMTLLYIIIVIMAFVFVVLTSGMIEEESAIIGTLLASGYRRRELVAHYLARRASWLAAAAVGNVVGFTLMSGAYGAICIMGHTVCLRIMRPGAGAFSSRPPLCLWRFWFWLRSSACCARWVTRPFNSFGTKRARAA